MLDVIWDLYTMNLVELVPHSVISDWGQFNVVLFCATGTARSHQLCYMKTKSDVVICGQLTDYLGVHCHVIVT